MKRRISWATVALLALAVPAWAGNGAPNGAHYSLNIIGVDHGKNADMTGSNRHTIFVALGAKGDTVTTRIYLTPGEFTVCDGNGFDAAFDCAGQQIAASGAVFQLPCNTNVPNDQDVFVPCDAGNPQASYEVWGRALGKPGGSAVITTCATDTQGTASTADDELVCSTENTLNVFDRGHGKQVFQNVTKELTSLVSCVDIDPDPNIVDLVCTRTSLFAGDLEDWFWQYDNQGLRLAQLRFYRIQ